MLFSETALAPNRARTADDAVRRCTSQEPNLKENYFFVILESFVPIEKP